MTFQDRFNVVFSNATLHWVDDHEAVLKGLGAGLRVQGRILLQMGGQGNASEILQAVNAVIQKPEWDPYFEDFTFPYYFYSPADYRQWLPKAGFTPLRVELLPKDMTHDGPSGLAGWIRTTWFPYVQCVPEDQRNTFVSAIVDRYLQAHPIGDDGLTHVDMVRLEVEAQKE